MGDRTPLGHAALTPGARELLSWRDGDRPVNNEGVARMSDRQYSAPPTEAPLGRWEADPERQAIGEAIGEDRRKVLIGAWAVTGIQAFLLLIAIPARNIPPLDLLALSAGVTIQLVLAIVLHLVPRKHIYGIISAWLTLIGFSLVAQLTTFYFGPERTAILNGTLPVLSIAISVVIVLAGTILKPYDALRYSSVLIASLMLITSLHAWLFWKQASTHYAMMLMLVDVFLIAPLTMLLVFEQRRIHTVAVRALQQLATQERESSQKNRQQSMRDPLTGMLNRTGITEALNLLLSHQAHTAIAFVSLTNAQHVRQQSGDFGYEDLLCQAAQLLLAYAPEAALCGRHDAADFIIWRAGEVSAQEWTQEIERIAGNLRKDLTTDSYRPQITVGEGLFERGTLPAVALEDLSFRSFMYSIRD